MSDPDQIDTHNQSVIASAESPLTSGAKLKAARLAQGLHIGALAVTLKVPVKKLEALEADRLDLLPDTVFVRALASSVCRVLKIDAAPILAGLPFSEAPHINTDEMSLNTPFRSSGHLNWFAWTEQITKPVGIGLLLLILGIFTLLLLPRNTAIEIKLVSNEGVVSPENTVISVEQSSVPSSQDVSSPAVTVSPITMADAGSATSLSSPAVNSAVGASGADQVGVGVLTLLAQGESWVEVTDAKGGVQLRKTMVSGELIDLSGALPLTVIMGRADVVSVMVRGQPFDVAAFSKGNVARFEVK